MNDKDLEYLGRIRVAMLTAAEEDTAYDQNQYKARVSLSRLAGHCAAAAYVVQQEMGGDILGGRVEGESHYWNRLPDGTEVDLTSDQFEGDGFHPVGSGRKVPERKSTNQRFLKFYRRVQQNLD